ncbi:MAG: VCBS repeat-containing protein [Candidatus Kerfeldbacteria bacterium]|nr:VCBS repeat-containing protein [Candidatus Kerfeldbacteria bacterium]
MIPAALLLAACFGVAPTVRATYGDTSTFVGSVYDGDGGAASAALLDFAEDVTADGDGNFYVADTFNNAIRKIDTNEIISTLAGGSFGLTDGTGSAAEFATPRGVAVDASGNVYVADTGNNAIRAISPLGVVSTLVSSGLASPYGVAVVGTTLFIADTGNNALKSVSTSGGAVTTITSSLNDPRKLAATSNGATVYVADNGSHRVVSVAVATGVVTVVAGSGAPGYVEGTGAVAQFENIWGLALTANESQLYVSDHDFYLTDRVRVIDLATGSTSLFASDTTQEKMIFPAGMVIHGNKLYVAMAGLGIIRRYFTNDASKTAVFAGTDRFGSREGASPLFGRPNDLFLSRDLRYLYVGDNNRIRRVTVADKSSEYIIGSIVDNYREGFPVGATGNNLDEARFSNVAGIVVNADGTALYVSDRWNNRIRKIDLAASPSSSSLVSGAGRFNGTGETTNGYQEGIRCTQTVDRTEDLTLQNGCAYFLQPTGIVLDATEEFLYVADTGNNRIRKVRVSDGVTTLVAGGAAGFADGTGSAAQFRAPWGIALSDDGTKLYVADRDNHRIRVIDLSTSAVTTLAGAGSSGYREGIGSAAYFSFPKQLKLGADGKLYLAEAGSHRVRQLDPSTGLTKLVSGSGNRGYVNGTSDLAEFNNLGGLAPETGANRLFVVDSSNDVLRLVDITGTAPYADPAPTLTSVEPDIVDKDWDKGTGLRVKVRGTGFRHGAIARLYTYKAVKTFVVSSTELVIQLPLSKMSAGWYDLTVTNVDGQRALLDAAVGVRDEKDNVPEVFFSVSESSAITAYSSKLRGGFFGATGNVWGDERDETIAGTGDGLSPQVRIFSNTGVLRGQFYAYDKKLKTGVRIAACDLNGDGIDEIVTVPGKGTAALVKAFDRSGKAVGTTGFYPLGRKFLGGANLVCGDLDGNGTAEILVAAAKGGSPNVLIFQANGKKIGQFRAQSKTFRGGIVLGLADLNGDGKLEILTAHESGGAQVRVSTSAGKQAYPTLTPYAKSFKGGLSIAGGDTNGDGKDELIVVPRSNAQARVKIYRLPDRKVLGNFLGFPRPFTGGAVVASGDVNGDGTDDIIISPASKYPPTFRMFKQNGQPLQ